MCACIQKLVWSRKRIYLLTKYHTSVTFSLLHNCYSIHLLLPCLPLHCTLILISNPSFFFCFPRLHHTFSTMLSKSLTGNPFCSQFLLSHPFLHVLQFTSVPFFASVIRNMDKKTSLFPNHICTHTFSIQIMRNVERCCLHSMCQRQLPIDAVIFKVIPSNFTHFSVNTLCVWTIYLHDKERKYIIAVTNSIVEVCFAAEVFYKCGSNVSSPLS